MRGDEAVIGCVPLYPAGFPHVPLSQWDAQCMTQEPQIRPVMHCRTQTPGQMISWGQQERSPVCPPASLPPLRVTRAGSGTAEAMMCPGGQGQLQCHSSPQLARHGGWEQHCASSCLGNRNWGGGTSASWTWFAAKPSRRCPTSPIAVTASVRLAACGGQAAGRA